MLGSVTRKNICQPLAPSETAASKSLEVLKQVASTGYMRKRLPQEFTVLQGGQSVTAFGGFATGTESAAPMTAVLSETRVSGFSESTSTFAHGTTDARTKAKIQGYTGDSCSECGNYTMVRNGSCLKCNSCGATTGCS